MNIQERLQRHFGAPTVLDACKRYVEEVFPDCANSAKPRDLYKLAQRGGVEVEEVEGRTFDGVFKRNSNGRSTIGISAKRSMVRTRFTLAHELGHWMLRDRNAASSQAFVGVRCDSLSDSDEERVANLLAAELLMPLESVIRLVRCSPLSIQLVETLSKRFEVSFSASLRRIADVANSPLVYLNVIPSRFRDLTTHAQVDEAIFLWPLQLPRYERERTRLARRYAFSRIQTAKSMQLYVTGPTSAFLGVFHVRANARPIPNCDLLAVLTPGCIPNHIKLGLSREF